jgi:hypothetical protein
VEDRHAVEPIFIDRHDGECFGQPPRSFSESSIISYGDMNRSGPDHGLEFLLAFNGRIHYLEKGYWLKFEIVGWW